MDSKGNSMNKYGWLIGIVALVAVNVLASFVHHRFDLTQEKRYTLTKPTRQLVQGLNEPVTIIVFLKGGMPAEFRRLANTTEDFLSTLREANNTNIHYQFIDPQDEAANGKPWADSLRALGATDINISVQVKSGQEQRVIYPYALVQYEGRPSLVNLFPSSKRSITAAELNNAEALMEYQFAKTIDRLVHPQKTLVAYAVGNGEPTGPETWDLVTTIDPSKADPQKQSNYSFGMFDLKAQPVIPNTISALIVVKPSEPFSDAEKLKIDQYVMRGGKVLWFIDNLYAEQDSLSFKSQLIAYDRNLNLQDLLFRYGVRLNPDLIMDLQCDFMPFVVGGSAGNPQYEFLHWNYYPLFESHNNHPINKNIGLVAGRFVNSIDTVEVSGIKKTYLLQSSNNSRIISTPALISPNENRNAPEDVLFKQHDIPAGVILEGQFTSLYKNRIGKTQMDSLSPYGGFKDASPADNKMIVVADGDMVLNDVSTKQGPLPMGMNLYTAGTQYEYQFANRDFFMNCLDYLTSSANISEARSKEVVLRLLDGRKVEAERTQWQLITIVLPVVLVILIGWLYQQIRKQRYASAKVKTAGS